MKSTLFRMAAFAILALLSACAESPRAIPEKEIVREAVPIATHAIDPTQIPALPPRLGPRPPSAQQAADAAFAAHCLDISWILKAFPLLRLGAGEEPSQAPRYPECEKH